MAKKSKRINFKEWSRIYDMMLNKLTNEIRIERKAMEILLPLTPPQEISELLAELYDLRIEKKNSNMAKEIQEIVKRKKNGKQKIYNN